MDSNSPPEAHPVGRRSETRVLLQEDQLKILIDEHSTSVTSGSRTSEAMRSATSTRSNLPAGTSLTTQLGLIEKQYRALLEVSRDPTTSSQGTGNTIQDEVISAGSDIYADELGPTDEGNNLRKSRVYAGSEGAVNEHSTSITSGSPTSEDMRSATTTRSNLPAESCPAECSKIRVLRRLNQFRLPSQDFEDPTSSQGTGNTIQDEVISAGSDIYADELGPTDEGNNLRKSRVYAGSEGAVNEHSTSITSGSPTSEDMRSATTTRSNLPAESCPAECSKIRFLRRLNQLTEESWDFKDQTQFSQGKKAYFSGSPIQGNNLRKLRVGGSEGTVDKPSISITNGSPSSETTRASTSCSLNTGGLTMGSAATTHCEKTANCRSKNCCLKFLSLFGHTSSAKRISPSEDLPSTSKEVSENPTIGSAITVSGDKTPSPTMGYFATIHSDETANHIPEASFAQGIKETSSSVRRSDRADQLSTSSPNWISTSEEPVNTGKVSNRNNRFSESPLGVQDDSPADDKIARAVTDLTSDSKAVQKEGAMAVRALAKDSPMNRGKIVHAGGIRPLIALISSGDRELQEQSVTAILNISVTEEYIEVIADSGAIKPLIKALAVGRPNTKANAANALAILSKNEKNNIAIGRSGAVPLLVRLLGVRDRQGQGNALAALFVLCSIEENGTKAVKAGIVKLLVGLMKDFKSMDFKSNIVDQSASVLNCLVPLADARTALKEEGGIGLLVKILEVGSERQKVIVLKILLQLCCSPHGHVYGGLLDDEGATIPLMRVALLRDSPAQEMARILVDHHLPGPFVQTSG